MAPAAMPPGRPDLGGIVIFATDRLQVLEVILSISTEKLWWECRNLAFDEGRFRSLDMLVATCRASTNRTSGITLRWVEEANRLLAGGESASSGRR